MKELVKQLCALPGVSSWEDKVREFLIQAARPYADELWVDTLGNLIVRKKGEKNTGDKLLLCAHMDEVGLMVRAITDEGYLKIDAVGSVDRRVLIGKPVLVGERAVPGVIGLKAYHLVSREEEETVPKLDEFYIDIGANNKAEAEKIVALGDVAVFAGDCVEFGNDLLKAKALDDRVGCAVLLTLLKEQLPMDCTFVFTVQEEVGTRGAFGAAFSVTPEIALVVEGTTAADVAGIPEHKRVCALGKGAVLTFMDNGSIADRGLFERLRELADRAGIPWQSKDYISGSNDAAAFQRTKSGVRTAVVAVPVRYVHAPASVACVRDFDAVLKLVRAFIDDLSKED